MPVVQRIMGQVPGASDPLYGASSQQFAGTAAAYYSSHGNVTSYNAIGGTRSSALYAAQPAQQGQPVVLQQRASNLGGRSGHASGQVEEGRSGHASVQIEEGRSVPATGQIEGTFKVVEKPRSRKRHGSKSRSHKHQTSTIEGNYTVTSAHAEALNDLINSVGYCQLRVNGAEKGQALQFSIGHGKVVATAAGQTAASKAHRAMTSTTTAATTTTETTTTQAAPGFSPTSSVAAVVSSKHGAAQNRTRSSRHHHKEKDRKNGRNRPREEGSTVLGGGLLGQCQEAVPAQPAHWEQRAQVSPQSYEAAQQHPKIEGTKRPLSQPLHLGTHESCSIYKSNSARPSSASQEPHAKPTSFSLAGGYPIQPKYLSTLTSTSKTTGAVTTNAHSVFASSAALKSVNSSKAKQLDHHDHHHHHHRSKKEKHHSGKGAVRDVTKTTTAALLHHTLESQTHLASHGAATDANSTSHQAEYFSKYPASTSPVNIRPAPVVQHEISTMPGALYSITQAEQVSPRHLRTSTTGPILRDQRTSSGAQRRYVSERGIRQTSASLVPLSGVTQYSQTQQRSSQMQFSTLYDGAPMQPSTNGHAQGQPSTQYHGTQLQPSTSYTHAQEQASSQAGPSPRYNHGYQQSSAYHAPQSSELLHSQQHSDRQFLSSRLISQTYFHPAEVNNQMDFEGRSFHQSNEIHKNRQESLRKDYDDYVRRAESSKVQSGHVQSQSSAASVPAASRRVLSTSCRQGPTRVLSERVEEREVRVPRVIVHEDVIERVIVVPEKIIRESIEEETKVVRERVVEVSKPIIHEKIVEVPVKEFIETECPLIETIVQEKVKEVPKIINVERIIEVPKPIITERVVEVPEIVVREHLVPRIVEVPQIYEKIEVREVKGENRYVEVEVPEYTDVTVEKDVERIIPVPVELITQYRLEVPRLRPRYESVKVPLYVPRFVEVACPIEMMGSKEWAMAERYAERVLELSSQAAASLCEMEGLSSTLLDFNSALGFTRPDATAAGAASGEHKGGTNSDSDLFLPSLNVVNEKHAEEISLRISQAWEQERLKIEELQVIQCPNMTAEEVQRVAGAHVNVTTGLPMSPVVVRQGEQQQQVDVITLAAHRSQEFDGPAPVNVQSTGLAEPAECKDGHHQTTAAAAAASAMTASSLEEPTGFVNVSTTTAAASLVLGHSMPYRRSHGPDTATVETVATMETSAGVAELEELQGLTTKAEGKPLETEGKETGTVGAAVDSLRRDLPSSDFSNNDAESSILDEALEMLRKSSNSVGEIEAESKTSEKTSLTDYTTESNFNSRRIALRVEPESEKTAEGVDGMVVVESRGASEDDDVSGKERSKAGGEGEEEEQNEGGNETEGLEKRILVLEEETQRLWTDEHSLPREKVFISLQQPGDTSSNLALRSIEKVEGSDNVASVKEKTEHEDREEVVDEDIMEEVEGKGNERVEEGKEELNLEKEGKEGMELEKEGKEEVGLEKEKKEEVEEGKEEVN